MHLLILMLAIVLHDQFQPEAPVLPWEISPTMVGLLLWIGVPLLVFGVDAWLSRMALLALGTPQGGASLRCLERMGNVLRTLAMAAYVGALYLGMLTTLRRSIGDWVMLDELLMVGPMIVLILAMWAVYYPIDRRIRQASLLGRIDAGLPIYPIWTLPQFLLAQVRHQLLLIGAPLFLILAWQETLINLGPTGLRWMNSTTQMTLAMVGSGSVFLLAPVLIRHMWDTLPLPAGELRDTLMTMCRQYRIRVREILLWRTFGGMTNAAVMGVLGPVRFVLLSDALLDMLPRRQVEAVMAHELAHIRKHHILSLVLAALAGLEGLYLLADPLLRFLAARPIEPVDSMLFLAAEWVVHAAVVGAWAGIVGWVSRRLERQADTFAVQHMARQQAERTGHDPHETPLRIDPESVLTMNRALQSVADTNHMPIHKRSWRHGSIAWRQTYLRTLVGQPVEGLAIDRLVPWIQMVSVLVLILTGLLAQFDTIDSWLRH